MDQTNLNARIAVELNDAFEKACIDRKLLKKEGVRIALEEFIGATSKAVQVPCTICGSKFGITGETVELISAGGDFETITVPADLRTAVEGFLRMAANPIADRTEIKLRQFLIDEFRERAALP